MAQAEDEYNRSVEAVNYWQIRRATTSAENPPAKKSKNRRNRNRKSRSHTLSNGSNTAVYGPQFPDPSAFLGNVHYQRTFDQAFSSASADNSIPAVVGMDGDMDLSMDGPLSPAASALLPSNLFSHEDLIISPGNSKRNSYVDANTLPQSPLSSGSPSNSLISSPRSSFHHMPSYPSLPDNLPIDGEQIEPASSVELGLSGTRKFVNLFNFTRQRGKTLPLDPPGLGSLKPSETRSFPREFAGPSLAPIGTGRSRSGSHNWIGTSFLDSKRGITKTTQDNGLGSKTFNPFNPKYDPLEPSRFLEPVSPRPSSVASFEGHLPLPGSDVTAMFGWPTTTSGRAPTHSHKLSLLSNPWSGFQSLSANASLTSLMPHTGGHENQQPQTRPVTPKLNPAAPAFERPMVRDQQPSFESAHDSASSIHADTSSLQSLDGTTSLESASTKDSLFTRLSAPKFWMKKEGTTGFFGRKRDHASETGEDADASGDFLAAATTSVIGPGTPTGAKSTVGGFFTRKKEKEKEPIVSDVDETDGRHSTEATRPTTPLTATSLWSKKDTFFGRKKELQHQPSVEAMNSENEELRPLQQEISPLKKESVPRLFSKTWKGHDSKEKDKEREKDKGMEKEKDSEKKEEVKRKEKNKRRKDKKRGDTKGDESFEQTSGWDETESSSVSNSFTG